MFLSRRYAGVQPGDMIVAINGKDVRHDNMEAVLDYLQRLTDSGVSKEFLLETKHQQGSSPTARHSVSSRQTEVCE